MRESELIAEINLLKYQASESQKNVYSILLCAESLLGMEIGGDENTLNEVKSLIQSIIWKAQYINRTLK